MKQRALLRLFNAVEVGADRMDKVRYTDSDIERMVRNGYILAAGIEPDKELFKVIESVVGISGEKANAAFHKSWAVIRDTPQEILWLQAIVHYFTTYGFERAGCYSDDTIYIPHEKLELPGVKEDIPLVVIRGLTREEILEKIVALGGSGIALHQDTLDDIMDIVIGFNYACGWIDEITNRELKALLYDYYGIVPSDPVEFLRHLISKLTDESLVIKNSYLIEKIKSANGKFLDELLKKAPPDLATIFFRYKPLFLAMKTISRNKTFFNRLRKQADTMHKPLPLDYLNSVTMQIKKGSLVLGELEARLKGASIFRKSRLLNALGFRTNRNVSSIVYQVRNGKGWVEEFDYFNRTMEQQEIKHAIRYVTDSIANDLAVRLAGKVIYIPSYINYAFPVTEKQFTGFIPHGSYVVVPDNMVFGIHWFNTKKRVDLDLSLLDADGKIGWNAGYRNSAKTILFSGDVTSAPLPFGASELFYVRQGVECSKLLMLNYYNFVKGDEVEAKIFVANEAVESLKNNYMVDVSNILASANVNITKKQNVLGIVDSSAGLNRFYFANVSIGSAMSASCGERSEMIREYLVAKMTTVADLRYILNLAGAIIFLDRPEEGEYIDLSPAALDKNTIIDLLAGE